MKQLFTILTLFISTISFAQNVGIGTTTPDASALFDVNSTSKGILIPRMTLAQRTAIASPANGLMIYQTDGVTGFYYNRGSSTFVNWSIITEGKQYWSPSLSNNTDFFSLGTGQVGIGNTNPTIKLHVTNTDSAIALLENSQTLANDVDAGLFFKTGPLLNSFYTGGIRTTGTSGTTARLSLLTGTSNSNGLQERVSIDNAGNMGIGTTTPGYLLDINGRARLRHNGSTSGMWYNKANNTEATLIGMVNDTTLGFYSPNAPIGWKVGIDVKNGLLGIGITDPTYPLSFPAVFGKKISIQPGFSGDAGISMAANQMRIHTDNINTDVLFGVDNISTGFSEKVWIKGNGRVGIGGNPANKFFILDNSNVPASNIVQSGTGNGLLVSSTGGSALVANSLNTTVPTISVLGGQSSIVTNGNIGIDNSTPLAPLSFASEVGNKISLWGNANSAHYGLGIQGSLLQLYSSANNADIAFGYGSSSSFTENARFLGVGNMHLGKYTPWLGVSDNRKINFGDGDFVYVGEVGNDDRLELRAQSFNFKAGDVFIGTNDFVKGSGYKLRVGGKIYSEEVRVQLQANWPDYVFEKNYKRLSINELEKYVTEHKHLPNIPSSEDIEKNGQHLGEVQRLMLEKIEELSLYIIELKKEIDVLKLQQHEKN